MASTNGSPRQVSPTAAKGTIAGVDVDYADPQPDLSYPSYFQQPGVHKSEAMPYRSSVSPSVGMRYKPVSGSVFAKNYPKSSTSENQNSSQYAHRSGSLTSRLPKILTDTRKEMEIQKKAPHLHSNFTAAAPPRTYNQTGNLSSFANPRSHVFSHTNYRPNSSTNYRPGASTNYRPNASTNYRPNASTDYRPNASTNYRPIASTVYRPNASTDYRPNASTDYRPNASTDYRPNASTNYRPNASTNYRVNASTNYRPNASTNYRPNASTNYRQNGTVSNVNDRVSLSEEFRNGVPEMSKEMTRGPRFHQKSSHPQSSAVKDEFAITVCRDRYNLPDFQTKYESAKFYMIKSFNEDDIHKGIKHDVWTSTPHGNKKLNAAFQNAEAKLCETGSQCPVFLFFSVNASGQFVGVAEMLGPVDFKKDMKFWKLDKYNGFFPIKWHIIKDVPNRQFVHIILQNNENKCVTFSRDTQEIGLKEGLEMLKIFKSYQAKTCLLDDFDFYENREKLIRSEKITEQSDSKQEVYNNDGYYNTMKAREEEIEMHSSGSNQESLVKLTKNLSLNPSVRQGFR